MRIAEFEYHGFNIHAVYGAQKIIHQARVSFRTEPEKYNQCMVEYYRTEPDGCIHEVDLDDFEYEISSEDKDELRDLIIYYCNG